jgi:hypothetical protein
MYTLLLALWIALGGGVAQSEAGSIQGQVVATDGITPVSGALVVIQETTSSFSAALLSNSSGAFLFDHLAPGKYRLVVSKPPYLKTQFGSKFPEEPPAVLVVGGNAPTPLTVKLTLGSVIQGTLRDGKGTALPDVEVRAYRVRRLGDVVTLAEVRTARSDDRGQFRVFGLIPGDYIVAVQPPPSSLIGAQEMSSAMIDELLAALARGERAAPSSAGASRQTNASLMSPVYFPDRADPGGAAVLTLDPAEEKSVDLVWKPIQTVSVSGVVIGDMRGRSATVALRAKDEIVGIVANSRSRSASVAQDGGFRFSSVPPGRYSVITRVAEKTSSGDGALWASADVVVGLTDEAGISLVLRPAIAVSGTAQFSDSLRASGVQASVLLKSGSGTSELITALGASVDSRSAGSFRIDGVPPGAYRFELGASAPSGGTDLFLVRAELDGRDALNEEVDLEAGSVPHQARLFFSEMSSELAGTIEGFHDPADSVILVFPEQERYWQANSARIRLLRPSPDGRFESKNIPAGRYRLILLGRVDSLTDFSSSTLRSLLPASVAVEIRAGERTVQDLKVVK